MLRKILFGLFEFVAVCSFLLLLCIGDETPIKAIFILFSIFASSACMAVLLDNPHRIIRYVLPALIVLLAFVHTIFRPIVKVCASCYKLKKQSGSFGDCFLDCIDTYDDWVESEAERKSKQKKAKYRKPSKHSNVVDFERYTANG